MRNRRRGNHKQLLTRLVRLVVVLLLILGIYSVFWFNRTRVGATSVSKPAPPKPVICIDPGHPSESNDGRTVQNGQTEIDINWKVACILESLFQKDERVKVMKTRTERDQYMRNSHRAELANQAKADLVLHLHCDTGGGSGFTVYHPDGEGHAEGRTGPTPDVITESSSAAKIVGKTMNRMLRGSLKNRGIRGESSTYWGSRNGALTSSVFSEVPTITVEMVFLSNVNDARFISKKAGQEKMAKALAKAAIEYLKSKGKLSF